MTKKNYLKQRFASIGIQLTEADLLDMNVQNPDDELQTNQQNDLYIAFVKFIPQILLRPTSISEGGTSISRANKDDITAFYSNECSRLGLKNELSKPKPTIRFL
ncbi:DUF6706 family protein [Capnocytophaga canimorsus]|uniref:DUF6706 family protein n=1 Tax=Capnocytophaga canimorsus TaxID=28188 RepID=UPI0037CE183E